VNLLYVTLNSREQLGGLSLLALFLLPLPFLWGSWLFPLFTLVLFSLSVWVFRRFLQESFQVPLVTPGQILLKAALAAIVTQLSTLLTNDLIYYFLPNYFLYTDLGPMFYCAAWESVVPLAQRSIVLTFICLVVLLPVTEELLFRGLIFGTLYRRSPLAGFLLTLVIYTFIRLLPVLGQDTLYLCVCALQYIPMTIYLSWVYVRSDTIAAPMAAHMLINAVNLYTLRSYYA
jgi:membrane protease YdiL (CAAX protease family)